MTTTGESARTSSAGEFTAAASSVVTLCFLLNALGRGLGESFAVFYGEFLAEFDWSRAAISSIYSLSMIGIGVAGPLIGSAFDRLGGRIVCSGGLLAYAAGFFIASRMEALWQGWLGLGVLAGLGAAATGMTPATGILARWFDRRLGTATGIAYAGLAAGAMLLAPLARVMIDAGGWRWTYERMSMAMLLLALVVMALPWRRIDAGAVARRALRHGLLPRREVLTRAPFWGLFGVFFVTAVATYVVQVQTVIYLEEAGYAPLTATLIFGLNGLLSILGIVGAGWLADRFGHRSIATVSFSASIVGVLALAALGTTGPNLLLVAIFALCFGSAMGSRGPLVSSLAARLFPGQVGAVFGAVMLGLGLGGAFGAWIAGWLHGITGGYGAGFAVAILASLLGLAQFWLISELGTGRWRENDG